MFLSLLLAIVGFTDTSSVASKQFVPTGPEEGPVPQMTMLKATGLYLTDNPVSAPPGSLSVADDAIIRRGNVLEPRRGNAPDLTTSSPVRALTSYRGAVIGSTLAGTLVRRASSSSEVAYPGDYTPPAGTFRTRFAQAKDNLYLTSAAGVYRLDSLTGTPALAGVPAALEGSASLTGSSGFLPNNAAVAYRFVWGRRDANGNLLLGAPSGRLLVTDTSGGSRDVVVTTRIPAGIVANVDFLQIYRTETRLTSDGDPGEEMAQVAEVFPTAADIAAKTLSYLDVASVTNGPTAYFAPSQGGIVNSKARPPVARDMAVFKGHAFYAVDSTFQSFSLTLLAVGGSQGLDDGDGIRIVSDAGTFNFYAGATEDTASGVFERVTSGTAAQNIESTARSFVRVLNAASGIDLSATYASAANDVPGLIVIQSVSPAAGPFTVLAINETSAWTPALRSSGSITEATRVANVVTLAISATLSVSAGDTLNVTSISDPGFSTGVKTITSVTDLTTTIEVTYVEAGPDDSAIGDPLGMVETTVAESTSEDGVRTNTWALSSFEEPEAVPPGNYFNVGGETSTLYRIIAQGDGLWFFTSEGVYRLSGDTEDNFTLRPFDLTVKVLAADSVVALENRVWAWTDQGVVAISDVGVEVMSHVPGRTSIQKPLQEIQATFSEAGASNVLASYAFAMAYETEHEYRLWLPDSADDTSAAFAYVFNTQQGAWTKHNVPALHAYILPEENRQYLAKPTAALARERKALTAADLQDATGVGIPYDVNYTVLTADNPGTLKQWREVVIHLEAPVPATVGVCLSTEVSTSEECGTLPTNGLTTVRTYVPVEKSYSTTLTVGVNHSTSAERCSVLGISVLYTEVSNAVR